MKLNNKKIIYLQYSNPGAFPPLENSAWVLAEAGWKVKFVGTKALGTDSIQIPSHQNIVVELAPFCYPGIRQKIHFLFYSLRCLKEILLGRYDCVYVSDLFSCPAGWIASSLFGVRVLYHEHDTPDAPRTGLTRWLHWTRKKLAQSAELCIFPQIERAQSFSKKFSSSKIQICHNMPLRQRIVSRPHQPPADEFRLWYHGSLVPTLLPMTVLDALAILPKSVTLHFAGYEIIGFPNFLKSFFSKAKSLGVQSRVFYEGALSRIPLFDKARESDLGLALFARDFREPMVGASNKPFDYMACGLPLLINDSKEWEKFFGPLGVAKSCNPESGESIAEAVEELRVTPDKMLKMREFGLKKISNEWNYESQFAPVVKLLESKP